MMGGPEFFRTAMGRRFFEGTMPKIADELARLNTTLAALVAEMKTSSGRANPPPESVPPVKADEPWQATLAAIARQHLQIDTLEPRGADSRDVHEAALRSALQAAYRAGLSADPRPLRTNDATSEPADGSAEPR